MMKVEVSYDFILFDLICSSVDEVVQLMDSYCQKFKRNPNLGEYLGCMPKCKSKLSAVLFSQTIFY